jgi:hypothetical protein
VDASQLLDVGVKGVAKLSLDTVDILLERVELVVEVLKAFLVI